jgi:hypothetical protein
MQLISLLAFAREDLPLDLLTFLLKLSRYETENIASSIPFIEITRDNEKVRFISDAYRQFARHQLATEQFQTESSLIEYYSSSPLTHSSLVVLPEMLGHPNRYAALKSLMSPEYIASSLDVSHDSSLVRRTLRIAIDQARQQVDVPFLLTCTLAATVLETIASSPVADAEVDTLLELRDYGRALELANQAVLAEDRLHLLARIYNRMQQQGLSVPDSALADLEQLADSLDVGAYRERAIDIAVSLFDLLPETAIQLVERAAGGQSADEAIDIGRALLALRVAGQPGEMISARITDSHLRDFARSHSAMTSEMSPEEILAEVRTVSVVAAKLFLLTSWCNANRNNPDSFRVVDHALELITSDQSRPASMRRLRQRWMFAAIVYFGYCLVCL